MRIKYLSVDLTIEKEVDVAAREMMSLDEGERSEAFKLVFVLQRILTCDVEILGSFCFVFHRIFYKF